MKHIYQVPMSAGILALHRDLLNLAVAMCNGDIAGTNYGARAVHTAMAKIGKDDFLKHQDSLEPLIEQVVKNGEGITTEFKPKSPLAKLFESIGFDVHEVEFDSFTQVDHTVPCCGHPDEGSETDPECAHCHKRHP